MDKIYLPFTISYAIFSCQSNKQYIRICRHVNKKIYNYSQKKCLSNAVKPYRPIFLDFQLRIRLYKLSKRDAETKESLQIFEIHDE